MVKAATLEDLKLGRIFLYATIGVSVVTEIIALLTTFPLYQNDYRSAFQLYITEMFLPTLLIIGSIVGLVVLGRKISKVSAENARARFCPKCGKELVRLGANFCDSCGYRIARGQNNDAEEPFDIKIIVALALWLLGCAVAGARIFLLALSAAYNTISPQYYVVSYLIPLFVIAAIPMGAVVFLRIRHDRKVGKNLNATKRLLVAFCIVYAVIFYFEWWDMVSLVPSSLGLYLLLVDTGVITIPLVLCLSLSIIALRITSGEVGRGD